MKGNLVSSSITVPCASGTDPTSPTTLSPIPLTSPASSKRRRLPVETDPENILIKTLRTEHSMDWTSIANYLNRERQKRGEPQTMTQPAVYSRFVRNAPKIAQVNGEVGFDVKDFMYLRHPHYYIDQVNVQLGVANTGNRELSASGAPLNYGGAPMGGFRKRKAPAPAKKWKGHGHRSVRIKPNPDPKAVDSNAERLQDPGMTLHMMQAVEVVNRNFWTFVADEMERATGEFFDWGALERRFGEL
ncbi:hypothetical protein B0J11DRAFT_484719 [Dendryphion nanum]|uniref:Uncharacterized protein n=1 Tax=Dendryphion nanum TaxID=256645 RepID=A0A9P9IRP4_9PLEO|nr:hypothetical protein B0J11DRAFT_484719 [Dendryphion nanum]